MAGKRSALSVQQSALAISLRVGCAVRGESWQSSARLCRDEIQELLNGGIGLVICRFDLGRRLGSLLGPMMKQRVRQRPADALVEQDEHGGHPPPLVREAITVSLAIALQ